MVVVRRRPPGAGLRIRTGDKLILLGDDGLLSVLRATPQGQQRLAQVKLLDGDQNRATPLNRGRMYVRGATEQASLIAATFLRAVVVFVVSLGLRLRPLEALRLARSFHDSVKPARLQPAHRLAQP